MDRLSVDPDLSAGPGHHAAEGLLHLQLGRSFLAGPHSDDDIVKLRWWVREGDGTLVGKIYFGAGAQGPPGHAHGGSMAAVLDEALGSACWVAGHSVVAAELTTSFRQMLPLGNVYSAEAWIEEVQGRKVHVRGHIIDDEAKIYAEGRGIFVVVGEERIRALAQAWVGDVEKEGE